MSLSFVTIVVVNWNLKEETAHCLRTIQQFYEIGRTIVVDNGSTDGSLESLAAHFPKVSFLALPANLGFGAACNYGIRQALAQPNCEFVLLLNNDAQLATETLPELLQAAQAHPAAGVLGPKIYYQDDPKVLWYAGARRAGGVLAAVNTKRGQVDCGQADQRQEVDYVFGAAMLIRRAVFEKIGVFDENFFLYMEDLDFCLRAQKAGFRLLFVPQAVVYHQGSASTRRRPSWRKYHYVRSTLHFLRKHLHSSFILPASLFWLGVFAQHLARDLSQGQAQDWLAYGRGFWHWVRDSWGWAAPALPPARQFPRQPLAGLPTPQKYTLEKSLNFPLDQLG